MKANQNIKRWRPCTSIAFYIYRAVRWVNQSSRHCILSQYASLFCGFAWHTCAAGGGRGLRDGAIDDQGDVWVKNSMHARMSEIYGKEYNIKDWDGNWLWFWTQSNEIPNKSSTVQVLHRTREDTQLCFMAKERRVVHLDVFSDRLTMQLAQMIPSKFQSTDKVSIDQCSMVITLVCAQFPTLSRLLYDPTDPQSRNMEWCKIVGHNYLHFNSRSINSCIVSHKVSHHDMASVREK